LETAQVKLYRPSIPLEVKCRVVLRQIGELYPEETLQAAKKSRCLGRALNGWLSVFAKVIGCEVSELRLDHDPPLALRPQERRGLGRKTYYTPDANDPEHLFYRPHGAQHAGSHHVKTFVRGEHGQFSDIALIKRQRRRERPAKRKAKIPSRPFQKRGK
jgi:hypothetical protein